MPQITTLARLRELSLDSIAYPPVSLAGLSALGGSLTALKLEDCYTALMPSTLASLTGLACLTIVGLQIGMPIAAFEAAVAHALPALQRITRLKLEWEEPTSLPAALAHAPELQKLSVYSRFDLGELLQQGLELPAGPWPQLRKLEAGWPRLLASAGVSLHGMGRLEKLKINTHPWPPLPTQHGAWNAFWTWAAQHQPLSSLLVWWGRDDDEPEEEGELRTRRALCLANAMLSLQRARPGLHVAATDEY